MSPEELERRRWLLARQYWPAEARRDALARLTPEQERFAEQLAGPGWREAWFTTDLPAVVELFG